MQSQLQGFGGEFGVVWLHILQGDHVGESAQGLSVQ